jgi:hypothetical protein
MASDLQKKWEERISRAKKKRKAWEDEFRTQLGRDYFEGRQNPGYPEDEWITVNKIYSHLQAQLPLLYSMDPYFYVKPEKFHGTLQPQDLQALQAGQTPQAIADLGIKCRGRQGMLNYLKKELRLKEKARLGIQDAHFEYGVLKVRRASTLEKDPRAGKPIMGEDNKPLKDPDSGEVLKYPDVKPVNERYEWLRVHPCDLLFDEDAGPLEDSWGWLGQHRVISKADALADPTFNRKAVRSAKGKERSDRDKEKTGIVSTLVDRITRTADDKNESLFLDIWEIYDLKKREWLTVCEEADDLFIDPATTPKGIEKHPFSILRFTLRDNSPYPIPPVSPALDPQKEYSLSRSRLLTHRKRFNRKYEVVVTKLTNPDEDLSKIESGEDGTLIPVNAPGAVNPITDAPLDQQNLQELMLLNTDMVEIFGTPAAARGVADADSATEASILDKRLEVREGDRLSMVVDWIIESAKKMDQLVQTHIDRDEAVKVTGPQGEFWQLIREDDYEQIEGEYSYGVNLGASQPRLPEIERSQWIAFLSQVVVPFPHILTAPGLMKRMAEMFHIEDEVAIEELRQVGLKIMQGMMPMPGGGGGGGPSENPVAAVLGAAMGPMGGNVNGGGAPTVVQ